MSKFFVKPKDLNASASEMKECESELLSMADMVGGVASGLSSMSYLSSVANSLRIQSDNIVRLQEKTSHMSRGLVEISNWYKDTENKIVSHGGQVHEPESGTGSENGVSAKVDNGSSWNWDATWEAIGNFGIAGSGISLIGNIFTGKGAEKWLNIGGDICSIVGDGASAIADGAKTSGDWVKTIFGIGDDADGGTFANQIDDFKFKTGGTAAENVAVAANWAGKLLAILGNGFENYDEYKDGDISGGRAVAETVVESAVDIALDVGATAAVSAVATAAVSAGLIAGAPAVAVGLAAAGVVWAANGICAWATGGKDLGEFAADIVCDVGEGAVQLAKDVAEGVKDVANKVADGAKDIADKTGKAIKNGLSSAWKGVCNIFG